RRCEVRLDEAVAGVQRRGFDAADETFARVREECPESPGPMRELAGVRFAERQWSEAAALAREAIDKDPDDAYALDVLASSLFMQDDAVGALRAWNRIGKPRIDVVRIDGIRRARGDRSPGGRVASGIRRTKRPVVRELAVVGEPAAGGRRVRRAPFCQVARHLEVRRKLAGGNLPDRIAHAAPGASRARRTD